MDLVNSATFIKKPPNITHRGETLLYTKELLCGRLFLGCYRERRYVSVLCQYRDVIEVNSEEVDLIKDLDRLKKKWLGVPNIKWVGITGPEPHEIANRRYCFWVQNTSLPFDNYWFQIKHVKLVEDELFLQLKCIRKCLPSYQMIQKPKNEISIASTPAISSNVKGVFWQFQNLCIESMFSVLTFKNLDRCYRLVVTILFAIISTIVTCVTSLGDFIIRLIREISLLVQAVSPIVIQLIDFFTKICGGLFILLASIMGWRRSQMYVDKPVKQIYHMMPITDDIKVPSANWKERNRMLKKQLFSHMKTLEPMHAK